MKTVINYKLQDDIIGRQTRRFESRKKFEKQLLEEILSGDTDDQLNEEADFAAKQAALRTGKRKEKTKQEEAYEIVEAAKLKGPRELVRVMQGNSRNPFIQAKGCAAIAEIASFSMRERHARYEGMFTFRRSSEVQPLENMNLTLGKIGALNCVQQALIKHRANKQVVWRATWCAQWLVKSKPNKDMFLENGGASCLKNVMACHEADKNLLKELNNLLILLGESKQTYFSHVFDGPVDTSKPSGCYHRGECVLL